jgi:hypothetical protein
MSLAFLETHVPAAVNNVVFLANIIMCRVIDRNPLSLVAPRRELQM